MTMPDLITGPGQQSPVIKINSYSSPQKHHVEPLHGVIKLFKVGFIFVTTIFFSKMFCICFSVANAKHYTLGCFCQSFPIFIFLRTCKINSSSWQYKSLFNGQSTVANTKYQYFFLSHLATSSLLQ